MAITPNDVRRKAIDTSTMKRLEQRIDSALIEAGKTRMYATFDTSIFPSTLARDKIIDTYRRAGWDVQYISDQRDGNYVSMGVTA